MKIAWTASVVVLLACPACQPSLEPSPPAAIAQVTKISEAPPTDPALLTFLQEWTRDAMAPLSYVARSNGAGPARMTFVYLTGPEYCGSGGCKLLILAPDDKGYAVIGNTTVTRPPIRMLWTHTNGRPDIGVHVAGGGEIGGYEARLAFDGSRYASNPTVAPAQRVENASGVVLIDDTTEPMILKE